jgi:hypothetical protein
LKETLIVTKQQKQMEQLIGDFCDKWGWIPEPAMLLDLGKHIATAITETEEAARAEERAVVWQEAIEWIRTQWLAAYSLEVFPTPPLPPAECSRDLISAAMGRHMAIRLIEEFEFKLSLVAAKGEENGER